MKSVVWIQGHGKVKGVGLRGLASVPTVDGVDSTVALIQALIPLGLTAVAEALKAEVVALAGERYSRIGGRPGVVRWCQQRGSVYLADQKLPITYRRVRDLPGNREVPLVTYQRLQQPRQADRGVLLKVLRGLSCRAYAECAEAVPAAFGLSPSTISRRFIRASARQLRALCERRLDAYDFVALFLDGKTFAADELVIALGITLTGEKVLLGFVQTGTENERVCTAFLRALLERGLRAEQGLLCIIDGRRACGRRSRRSSARRRWCSAVSGTSERMWWVTSRRPSRPRGGGSSRRPTSSRATPRRRLPSTGSGRSSASSTPPRSRAWTRGSRKP